MRSQHSSGKQDYSLACKKEGLTDKMKLNDTGINLDRWRGKELILELSGREIQIAWYQRREDIKITGLHILLRRKSDKKRACVVGGLTDCKGFGRFRVWDTEKGA